MINSEIITAQKVRARLSYRLYKNLENLGLLDEICEAVADQYKKNDMPNMVFFERQPFETKSPGPIITILNDGFKNSIVKIEIGSSTYPNNMRVVKVIFENGDFYNTSMAAHLTDEHILIYYKPGKIFNVGFGPEDNPQKIKRVEIII